MMTRDEAKDEVYDNRCYQKYGVCTGELEDMFKYPERYDRAMYNSSRIIDNVDRVDSNDSKNLEADKKAVQDK